MLGVAARKKTENEDVVLVPTGIFSWLAPTVKVWLLLHRRHIHTCHALETGIYEPFRNCTASSKFCRWCGCKNNEEELYLGCGLVGFHCRRACAWHMPLCPEYKEKLYTTFESKRSLLLGLFYT